MKDNEYTDGVYAILKGAEKVDDEGGWGSYSYEFHTDKFEFHPFLWDYLHEEDEECDCKGECPEDRPQFRHFATGLEVHWYKYIGRSMESNKSMTALEFYRDVVVDCLEELKKLYEEKHEGN